MVFLDFVNNQDWIWKLKCSENHNQKLKIIHFMKFQKNCLFDFSMNFFPTLVISSDGQMEQLYWIDKCVCVIFIVVVFFLAFCFLSSFWNSIGRVIFRLLKLNLKFNFVVYYCIKAVRGNHYGWMHRNFYWLQNFYCIIIGTDVEVVQMVASTQRPSKHYYKREHPSLV